MQLIDPRDVPLGGLRAMNVRRTLPHRERSFVGAWCFVDHYGPDRVKMDVPPHPHTGLQTVSWLFEGEIEHRDSGGKHAMVRPGEVNLMTAGHGICHSEVSTPTTDVLHGVQLWVTLPAAHRDTDRGFEHHAAPLVELAPGLNARVFIGSLAGETSPVSTFTPLLGAELLVSQGTTVRLPVDVDHEHGLLLDSGALTLDGAPLTSGQLAVLDRGATTLEITATADSRAVLLGGAPFEEQIVMWWNFIGSDHDEIAHFRQQWAEESDRFGSVAGYLGEVDRIPGPALPTARLRPRGSRGK